MKNPLIPAGIEPSTFRFVVPKKVHSYKICLPLELDYFILTGDSILDVWVNSPTKSPPPDFLLTLSIVCLHFGNIRSSGIKTDRVCVCVFVFYGS